MNNPARGARGQLAVSGAVTVEALPSAGSVIDEKGQLFQLHSNTSLEQCAFLKHLIQETKAKRCLEIGLAYGISSLAICDAISRKPGGSLTSIDPHQASAWNGIGLLNLQRAGFRDLVEFHPRQSYEVLPTLPQEGRKIDFAYVDSENVFDVLLVDAFYLIRPLEVRGTLVFDDCDWPGVRKLVRYLTTLPHLRVLAKHGTRRSGALKRFGAKAMSRLPFRDRIFRAELTAPDEALGVAASCVAFVKTSEDNRSWDWYVAR